MEYLYDYALFAAKLLTAVILLALSVIGLAGVRALRRRDADDGALTVRKLNDRARAARRAVAAVALPRREFKALLKADRRAAKAPPEAGDGRVFVCRFAGDLRASAVIGLREEISAILSLATAADEVIVVLESAGGSVQGYGLAASQLNRVRAHGLRLTVVVDRIAASGGYLMACVAHELVAAPFAVIGSIGVVAELPNFHRLLKEHAIDYEQVTAGKYKRTLSLFGENTTSGRDKLQSEIDEVHTLFKEFVQRFRPALDLDQLATGEYWLGVRARELGLIDRIATSDEILHERMRAHAVFEVTARSARSWRERLRRRLHGMTTALR